MTLQQNMGFVCLSAFVSTIQAARNIGEQAAVRQSGLARQETVCITRKLGSCQAVSNMGKQEAVRHSRREATRQLAGSQACRQLDSSQAVKTIKKHAGILAIKQASSC